MHPHAKSPVGSGKRDPSPRGAAQREEGAASFDLVSWLNHPSWRDVLGSVIPNLAILDAQGKVLWGNPGLPDAPGPGIALPELVTQPQQQLLREALERVRQTREAVELDVRYPQAGDAERWLSWRIAPLAQPGGAEGFSVLATDVTRRRILESALQESLRAQSTLWSNLPGMAYRCINDHQWTMEFISGGCLALTGYPPEDFIANRAIDFGALIHPEDIEYVWDAVQAAVDARKAYRLTYRLRTADGVIKWVWEQGRGVYADDGALLALEGYIADVTDLQAEQEGLLADRNQLARREFERRRELSATSQNLEIANEERQKLRWLLKAIVDHAPIMLFVKNAETLKVELWNDTAALVSGIPAPDILGKTGYEVFPRKQMDDFLERDRVVIRDRKLVAVEEVLTTPHGDRWLYTRKIPMIDDSGEVQYLLGISEDITDRKIAEEESEERSRLSLLSAAVGQVITSDRSESQLLQEAAELIVKPLDALQVRIWMHASQNPWFEMAASAGASTALSGPYARISEGEGLVGETAQARQARCVDVHSDALTPDWLGWEFPNCPSSVTAYPMVAEGNVLGVLVVYSVGSFSDAARRALGALADNLAAGAQARRFALALQQSLERFDLMVDGAKVGLWDAMIVAHDPYNPANPIYYSPRFKELLGFAPDELPDVVGSWSERLFPADRERAFRALDDHLFRRVPYDIEYRMVTRSGQVRWFAARGQAQWTPEGTPVRMSGSFEDVTSRKESEAQLLEAREAAEAANKAKSRFLANISHEIRTPISAMLGATELLARADAPDRQRRADSILRNTRHLLSLIDDLLDFSRLEAGKLEVKLAPSSLVEVLADIRAVTTSLAHKPGVEFRIEIASDLPETVATDSTRLRQAVINLVNNALKFTESGWVLLRVSANPDAPDPRLIIEVSDSGIGIAPAELTRVFDAFERATHSPRVESGVGLGLTISRWIAGQLGGDLNAQSELGRGSVFTLRIATGPLEGVHWLTPVECNEAMSASFRPAAPELANRLHGTVLLAEDYGDTREVLETALRGAGAEVVAVENGLAAVEAAMGQSFDLILMDVRMPVLDGLSATARLRAAGCLAPIVALTASAALSDRQRILDAGFDDLWTKPISLDRIIDSASHFMQSPRKKEAQGSTLVSLPGKTRDRLRRLTAEFVAGLPRRLAAIREAVAAGRSEDASAFIHQMIGAAGIHGLDDLSAEALRLQRCFNKQGRLSLNDLSALDQLIQSARGSLSGNDRGAPG